MAGSRAFIFHHILECLIVHQKPGDFDLLHTVSCLFNFFLNVWAYLIHPNMVFCLSVHLKQSLSYPVPSYPLLLRPNMTPLRKDIEPIIALVSCKKPEA